MWPDTNILEKHAISVCMLEEGTVCSFKRLYLSTKLEDITSQNTVI